MPSTSLGSRNQPVSCPHISCIYQTYLIPKNACRYLYAKILVSLTPFLPGCCHLKFLLQHPKLQPFVGTNSQVCYLSMQIFTTQAPPLSGNWQRFFWIQVKKTRSIEQSISRVRSSGLKFLALDTSELLHCNVSLQIIPTGI